MADSKIYLNVPFAQKDAAKALGAKWDAAHKKWYVPASINITPFARWQSEAASSELSFPTHSKPKTRTSFSKHSSSIKNEAGSAITYPTSKDFVAYNGDEPPWE
jgi:hypothetical protein